MIITNTITKKLLENIVHQTFINFGTIASSSLLDSLKLLGFYYATTSGISINIEDLKTPDLKKNFIEIANNEVIEVSAQWQQGFVSDTERFQTIIDSWNLATESLKNRIVEYYQNYDPTNNLYIMAFSGARGNMSQVRQLVGMRGLMSDQNGKIIDLPIQSNFREGLSSIDYIISSYGARKGIVDTALKTADSGYLTRRLIYLAQDLIIREKDCQTSNGVIFLLEKNTNVKNILGRKLISIKAFSPLSNSLEVKQISFQKDILNSEIIEQLSKSTPLVLNIRSPLTCKSNGSICQYCYGWDLARRNIIGLGETVGIIAAQSIGEPGTQLTMRTFHTGGIFTGEILKQLVSPFSGKILIPNDLKTVQYRTSHGIIVLKLQQEVTIHLTNWYGITKEIFLEIGSYLYIGSSSFIRKGQLISEYTAQSILPAGRRLKPIYSSFSGEIRFENLLVRTMLRNKRTIKVSQDDGVLWIAAGKIFSIPQESEYLFPSSLEKGRPFSKVNIVSPFSGIFSITENIFLLTNKENKFVLNFDKLQPSVQNSYGKFFKYIKNYQYVDSQTILGSINFFPLVEGAIYLTRKKEDKYISTYFLITDSDVWKLNSDQVNNFLFFQDKKIVGRTGNLINLNSKLSNSGFFLKKDGFKMIFQNAIPIFLSRGTILNYDQGDFILEKKVIATLVNYIQQTEDIVQGLPKIEELIEARKPQNKSFLAIRPGIILNSSHFENNELLKSNRVLENNIIKFGYPKKKIAGIFKIPTTKEKQFIYLSHSIFTKNSFVTLNSKIFHPRFIPTIFKPVKLPLTETQRKLKQKNSFAFLDEKEGKLLIEKRHGLSRWDRIELESTRDKFVFDLNIYKHGAKWLTIKKEKDMVTVYKNTRKDLIVLTTDHRYLYLKYLTPVHQYKLPLSSKVIFEPGSFIDIGEPITEGIIDIHELLHILFKYHTILDGILEGSKRSSHKFQLLLVNSIQSIYQSQGVNISTKHIEIIVKQMTSKVLIKSSGDSPLLPGELMKFSLIQQIYEVLKNNKDYKVPKFEPLLFSTTNSSLSKDGFLSAAGFQETKRVLTKASILGSFDWLRGLKESIIVGRLIPAGTTFLNYKNYLDNIYLFKN